MTERRRSVLGRIVGGLILLLGLAVAAGGLWLLTLHGSPYYAAAGAALAVAGLLMLLRHGLSLWLFAAILAGTLAWAIWEVGLDWWPLAARGDLLFVLALLLLLPPVRRGVAGTGGLARSAAAALGLVVLACVGVLAASLALSSHATQGTVALAPEPGSANAEWRAYGDTGAGQRFTPAAAITPDSVGRLHRAWVFHTHDLPGKNDPVETTFEVTPIEVGGTLYLCSPHQIVFALDAATGAQRWRYDPQVKDDGTFQHLTCRGVSYFAGGGAGQARIFLGTNDGRLISLDAATGEPDTAFGRQGTVDLEANMPVKRAGQYEVTSPPVVTDRLVVVNGSVTDNYSTHEASGVIRAYDARTGALTWAWDSGAADENAIPQGDATFTLNSPNSWITMAYDPSLQRIYVPMGVSTPDIWGGDRTPLQERYASSIVALDAATGHRVWSYQTVHHDLWDMDVPSQPTLIDLKQADGSTVPALLAPAKTGNIFVLDRRDGHLLVPAPERSVPQGAAPGDHLAATQPFSDLSFRPRRNLTGADMWGGTMLDELACRIQFHRLRYEGPFTPPSLQGTLVFPGNLGMFEWGGLAVDPVNQIAIGNPMSVPFVSHLLPRGPDNPPAPDARHPPGSETGVQPMYGTPYGVNLHPFLSPLGIPCLRPPWGNIAALDLKTMKIAWMHAVGTIRDSAPVPVPIPMGVPMLGGPMLTAGGVAFLTSTTDYYIRAFDARNGRLLWQDRLPAGGQSTPMSYALDGRQYVVTAAGGHGSFGTKIGDSVIGYVLDK